MAADGRLPAFAPYSKAFPAIGKGTGHVILKPIKMTIEDKQTGDKKSFIRGCVPMTVWHYTDMKCDHKAIEEKYKSKLAGNQNSEIQRIEQCEQVIKDMQNPPKFNNGNSAYYVPKTDEITLPKIQQFDSPHDYYATRFHELAHSTGHFTRLNRIKGMENIKKGSHDYSFEELVAELTACFVTSNIGILNDKQVSNSASYLKSWIKCLDDNPDWIVKAGAKASKASKYILNVI